MKRIKLFLAALAAIAGMGEVKAQEEGTYFLYNESTDLFISRGATWCTQAVAEKHGVAFEVAKISDGVYTLKNVDASLIAGSAQYLGSNLYTDNGTACNYTFAASGTGYTLTKGNGYVTAGTAGAALTEVATSTDNSVWQLLTREQYNAKLAERADRQASAIASSAGISGVSTREQLVSVITDADQYRMIDKTSSIGNADIGNGSGAWTKTNGNNRTPGSIQAQDHVFQIWNGSATISQNLSGLPAGIYRLTVQAFFRHGNTDNANAVGANYSMVSHLFAGENTAALTSWWDVTDHTVNSTSQAYNLMNADPNFALVETYVYVGEEGTLNVGINDINYPVNCQPWMVCGNFKLYYYTNQVDDADVTALAATIPTAVPATTASNLNALKTTLEGNKTIANYNALSNAITAANALVDPYAKYNSVKAAVEALDDDATIFTGSASVDISTAEATIATANSEEEINTAIAQLRAAATTFMGAVSVSDGKSFDITSSFITNASPYLNSDGWDCPVAVTPNASAKAAEFWNKSGVSISQTLATLPAGYYTLKAQAFARTGCSPIYIFAGDKNDPANKQELIKKSNNDISTMAKAGEWFDAGNGWNTLTFQITEASSFTIGLNDEFKPNGSHGDGNDGWLIWREFGLSYLGTEPVSVLAELYNTTKAEAEEVLDNTTYSNVQGTDRKTLVDAINDTPAATATSYKEKTSALIEATNNFIDPTVVNAWNSLVSTRAGVSGELPYASASKKTALDNAVAAEVTGDAAAALAQVAVIEQANRQYVESNAMAEGVTGAVNVTNLITNPDANDGGNGWSGSYGTLTSEQYTQGDGTQGGAYFDKNGASSYTAEQTIENLPLGTYLLTVTARAQSISGSYQVKATNSQGEAATAAIATVGNTGGVFGRGWNDASVVFTQNIAGAATIGITATHSGNFWMSFDRFRLVKIADVEGATEEQIAALNEQVAVLKAKIGFEDGEYAPYNNVESMKALNAFKDLENGIAKSIYDEAKAQVDALTWTPNEGEVNAFYDGTFSIQAPKADATSGVKGWTANNSMRQLINDATTYPGLESATDKTAMYTWQGTFEYGAEDGYQMPLTEAFYELSFYITGWPNNDVPNNVSVSLHNSDGTAVATKQFWPTVTKSVNDADPFVKLTAYFDVPAAGNYTFKVYTNHLSVFNDFKLYKAVPTNLALNENTSYTPEETYANVTLTRSFNENWATFVVPFDIDNATLKAQFGDDVQVSKISADDKTGLTFTPMDEPAITANEPVIMKVSKTTGTYTFDGVMTKEGMPTTTPVEGVSIVGNYGGKIDIPGTTDEDTNSYYYIASNKLKHSTGKQTIKGFRAYFQVSAGAAEGIKAFLNGYDFGGITDAIEGVKTDSIQDATIYDLSGRRVSKAQTGIYIVGGKKVVIK